MLTQAAEERARAAENERKMMENDRIAPLTFARVAASNELTRRYTGFNSTETLIEFTKVGYRAVRCCRAGLTPAGLAVWVPCGPRLVVIRVRDRPSR
jgi:hypothetical protein